MTVAVAGQPNTGKSTLFNRLTGLNQRVGNWTGKTVDRKEGAALWNGVAFTFVDLPGCYGMTRIRLKRKLPATTCFPADRRRARRGQRGERGTELVYRVRAGGARPACVVALNMTDVAEQEGRAVDAVALSSALGLPVIPLVGTSADGTAVDALLGRSRRHLAPPVCPPCLPRCRCSRRLSGGLPCAPLWAACKLFEGDEGLLARTETLSGEKREAIRVLLGDPSVAPELYASRQAWIDAACGKAVRTSGTGRGLTERWDRVLLHPLWGRLAAFLVIPAGCVLGAALGMMTGGLVLFAVLAWAPDLKAAYPGPLGSLAADALLPAFGWVVALLSMISALYAIFSFLEDTGYLARVAYLMDSFLSGLGIDGKSAIPLMMGFLCNTVSIAGSRVVDSPRRRLITLCMLPFIPCSGQMGVAFLFAFALFPAGTALLVVLGVSCLNLFMAGVVGRIMHATLPGRYANGLIMELPLYHRPNFRTIFGNVRTRAVLFLHGAAVNIFAALIVVWAISTFPGGTVETSWLYRFGRWLEPLGSFLGFDWRFTVALLSSFVAETTAGTRRSCSPWATDHEAVVQACGLPSRRGAGLHRGFQPVHSVHASISVLRSELGSWGGTLALAAMFALAMAWRARSII
ncbi:MAG: FeoB small GTPase domain-containing protein [Bilophila wadsworthia]